MPSLKEIIPGWIKEAARYPVRRYQRATSSSRSLPDFLVIGAQKSATTSLFSYLGQHPQLIPSFQKQIHFFDGGSSPNIDNFELGQAWYRAFFPLTRNIGDKQKTFEVSPIYLFNPRVPKRIFDLIPEVRLIAILRNPTERAISHYFHEKRRGKESLPMDEAFRQEETRLQPVIDTGDYRSDAFIHHSYKSRGLYKKQIDRFLDYFPLQKIHVTSSEDLFSDPNTTLSNIFEFLGVDAEIKVDNLAPRNVGEKTKSVDTAVYDYLNSYFAPHNQALFDLLGKDFKW